MANIEELLTKASVAAVEGKLTDTDRVGLYKLALSVAADELYRIEEMLGGTVNPASLLLIQHLGLICEPEVSPTKLLSNMGNFIEKVQEDGRRSESASSEVRGAEPGSTEDN